MFSSESADSMSICITLSLISVQFSYKVWAYLYARITMPDHKPYNIFFSEIAKAEEAEEV
ncbi:hypothetical protein PNA2_1669 [Pyrococcus sp. NA2]|nr:hypothetical protein PNA2_1669 [Pyrococcus sp. NA2]